MRGIGVSLGVLATLLGSTALVQAQDASVALSGTAGVIALNLPPAQLGVFSSGDAAQDDTVSGLTYGYSLGVSGSVQFGQVGDYVGSLGFNAFGATGSSSSSVSQSFSGLGMVVIPGLTTPAGPATIDLDTERGGANSVIGFSITDTDNGEGGGSLTVGTESIAADEVSASAVTPALTGNSFTFGGGNAVEGADDSALAFGAIANATGGIFIAVGDLDGLEIDTSLIQDFAYLGADVTLGLSGVGDGGAVVQGYAGPSYRYLGQRTQGSITIDIPEVDGLATVHPLLEIERDVDIATHYLGGVVGGTVSQAVSGGGVVSFGLEGGLYNARTTLEGSEAWTISGGSGVVGWAAGTQTVEMLGASASDNRLAFAGRVLGAYTHPLSENTALTFSGTAEYLSAAPRLNTGAAVTYTETATEADADWSSTSAPAPLLSFGDMWALSGAVSFTGTF